MISFNAKSWSSMTTGWELGVPPCGFVAKANPWSAGWWTTCRWQRTTPWWWSTIPIGWAWTTSCHAAGDFLLREPPPKDGGSWFIGTLGYPESSFWWGQLSILNPVCTCVAMLAHISPLVQNSEVLWLAFESLKRPDTRCVANAVRVKQSHLFGVSGIFGYCGSNQPTQNRQISKFRDFRGIPKPNDPLLCASLCRAWWGHAPGRNNWQIEIPESGRSEMAGSCGLGP